MRLMPLCWRDLSGVVVYACLVALLPQPSATAQEPKPADPSAGEIIDRVSKKYLDCNTYRDSGEVQGRFGQRLGPTRSLKTAFRRLDRFRFESNLMVRGTAHERRISWTNGPDRLTWTDKAGIQKIHRVLDALDEDHFSGPACIIPSLLMPDLFWKRQLADASEVKRVEDGKLDDVECFRIEAIYVGRPTTLWIAKSSYLVRRIDQEWNESFATTTTYIPVVDEVFPDKLLEFDPPIPK